MTAFKVLARRLGAFFAKSKEERELDAELRAHLEMLERVLQKRKPVLRRTGDAKKNRSKLTIRRKITLL